MSTSYCETCATEDEFGAMKDSSRSIAYALLNVSFGELSERHLTNVDLHLEQRVLHGFDVEYELYHLLHSTIQL